MARRLCAGPVCHADRRPARTRSRAGWPSFAAHAGHSAGTVLTDEGYLLPIFYGAVPDALDADQLRPRCAHATTYALLNALGRHAPADLAASATRIRESLPIVAR
jgi:hypothetical protein